MSQVIITAQLLNIRSLTEIDAVYPEEIPRQLRVYGRRAHLGLAVRARLGSTARCGTITRPASESRSQTARGSVIHGGWMTPEYVR